MFYLKELIAIPWEQMKLRSPYAFISQDRVGLALFVMRNINPFRARNCSVKSVYEEKNTQLEKKQTKAYFSQNCGLEGVCISPESIKGSGTTANYGMRNLVLCRGRCRSRRELQKQS